MTADQANVPLVDLLAGHAEVAAEVEAGFARVLSSGAFIKGPDVAAFESEFAEFSGVAHCVGVANGTDALELMLRADELPEGAGVVMPANTFVASAEAVVRAGGTPVFADVDDEHLLLDPAAAAGAVTDGVWGLLPVHLNGQLAPMAPLMELAASTGARLFEDAAQCQGATQDGRGAGSWGRAAGTSFYPGKNLGAYGDAGAVLTGDADLDRIVRELGDHGSSRKYVHDRLGFNSRLDTLQAVVLRAKLARLAGWNEARREAAARYDALLADVEGVRLPRTAPGNVHVWHLYAVRVARRDAVLADLNAAGIGAGVHYPVPVHLQPAFRALGHAPGDFPVAERAAAEILTLPLYPQITEEQQVRVVEALAKALRNQDAA
ncbi:DegT/DnrJ/EryC1/StrS family aminotransferase [Yinghuangia seranimata]|uniref:DegT/DnrJ/EryC1/StrS family aminotransferase n=1 Tax=Yinghuangia seranimata TaxID=408067 RepID=UPI00248B190C|nr:DegT/DnrJ/EryC1/StrS family aminotransferase [Yinghuangia seranimata]MDI2126742.1 DegT/DnrJ/EryC1/StrS family aminotransferase [Yinghuangia seranimata]